jgi:hypothetical protein
MIRGQPRTPVIPTGPNVSPVQYKYPNTRHNLPLTGDSDEGDEYSFEQGGSASASPSYPPIQMPQLTPGKLFAEYMRFSLNVKFPQTCLPLFLVSTCISTLLLVGRTPLPSCRLRMEHQALS